MWTNLAVLILIFASHLIISTGKGKSSTTELQDPSDIRLLLNGRIWHNKYSKVIGHPYFLTDKFLKGSVINNGRKFNDIDIRYDLISDELILRTESHPIIIMNKEMVDSFSLNFENSDYHIINSGNHINSAMKGYVCVLYNGPSTLYVKYIKKILPQAVDGRYDQIFQQHFIYIRQGSEIMPVEGRKKLFSLLDYKKTELRNFVKKNRIRISRKDPGTFIPLLKYYDSINK
jgi:hypothetical protein